VLVCCGNVGRSTKNGAIDSFLLFDKIWKKHCTALIVQYSQKNFSFTAFLTDKWVAVKRLDWMRSSIKSCDYFMMEYAKSLLRSLDQA
jgi:hypothetical protein